MPQKNWSYQDQLYIVKSNSLAFILILSDLHSLGHSHQLPRFGDTFSFTLPEHYTPSSFPSTTPPAPLQLFFCWFLLISVTSALWKALRTHLGGSFLFLFTPWARSSHFMALYGIQAEEYQVKCLQSRPLSWTQTPVPIIPSTSVLRRLIGIFSFISSKANPWSSPQQPLFHRVPVLVHGSPVLLNLTPKQNPWSHPQLLHCSWTNAICQQTLTEPSEHSQDLITDHFSCCSPGLCQGYEGWPQHAGLYTSLPAPTPASQTTSLSPTPHSSVSQIMSALCSKASSSL